jgi:DNA polymerase-3 subunit gamma/tau
MSQVLALKYRPASFDKLIGQDTITQTLTHALDQNRLSHAYLFSGLRGSGKTSTARIFSKSLICQQGPTSTPCEVCEHCKLSNENRHIDIIEMDGASSRKIDDIRNLIEQTKYKPNSARFKIFIIDEVHMLTKEAFNALLKTLEEPPEYVKFILATTDPMKLPATILSRTQHFRFKKIQHLEIIKHLSNILNLENVEYETEALAMLSRAGHGSLRDTLTLLDQSIIFSKNFIDTKNVASMLGILDPEFLEKIINAIFNREKDRVIEYIKELENYEGEVVIDELTIYIKEAFFAGDPKFSTMVSDRFFRILSESKNLLFINADSGFVLSLIFFKMMEALKIKDIDDMILNLEKDITIPTSKESPQNRKQIYTQKEEEKEDKKEIIIPKPQIQNHQNSFNQLIDKLYDRNYELGECFKNEVSFVNFENQKLILTSCASQNCKNTLRHSSGIIRHFVQEIFGIETKIEMQACDKKIIEEEESPPTTTASMIEDIEFNRQPNSCIENQVIGENQTKEIDQNDILDDPFVKRAGELFHPSKIIIKSKI